MNSPPSRNCDDMKLIQAMHVLKNNAQIMELYIACK